MSYCRWSSDFGQCDVYVYANVSGAWTTHVAVRRFKHQVPDEIRNMPTDTGEQWMAQIEAHRAWEATFPQKDPFPVNVRQSDGSVKKEMYRYPADSEYIDLATIGPEAGKTFDDAGPGECADRLEQLKARGFNVPQGAIDALREEAKEEMQE